MKDNFVTETIRNLANYVGLKVSENNDISTMGGGEKPEDNEKIKDNIPPNNQKQQDIDNANQANDKLNKKGDDSMKEKKDRVDALIANKATPYEEEHREFLMSLEDCPLSKIEALAAKAQKTDELEVNFKAEKEKAEKLQQQIEANKKTDPPAKPDPPPKAQTPEQYIANAPPEMQEVLQDGLNLRQEKRKNLITAIMANENNRFAEDGLKKMDMGMLENIAAMANIPKANYAGQGGGPKTQQNADIPSLEVLSCFPDNGGSK